MCSLTQVEDMDADRIFVTSSMQEAMYLLEHCTNLAVGNVKFSYFEVLLDLYYILCTGDFCLHFMCLYDLFL